jgi:hypothetical protein
MSSASACGWAACLDVVDSNSVEFTYRGIIAHLSGECGGNVAEQGVMKIVGSSFCRHDAEFAAKNAADLGSDSVFYSGSDPGQWVCHDFGDMAIIPAHYSIQAGGAMSPRNWVVEGREWGFPWLELDRREKGDSLKVKNVTGTFPVSRAAEVCEIRLRQAGWNHDGKDCLVVSSFQIFGSHLQTTRWRKFHRELAKGNQFLAKVTRVGRFPPLGEKRKFDVPDGIIAHLARECGGNVHGRHAAEVTSGSFEKDTLGDNAHSGAYNNRADYTAKNIADLETDTHFVSACRSYKDDIPPTKNNWLCYDFKKRRIVPTHYAIRTNDGGQGGAHLKTWLVGTPEDGKSWREVAREEKNRQLNGQWFTCTFTVSGGGECRFIRLVNIGRNHHENDVLCVTAWEISGSLVE